MSLVTPSPWTLRWQRFSAASIRAFHVYAGWLVTISWKRFFALSVLLLISAALLQNIPPLSWSFTQQVRHPAAATPPQPPARS